MLTVDVFVYHPIPFADLRSRAERMVIDNVPVYVCSIDDLITLKQQAGRPQDLIDIENRDASRRKANVANAKSTTEDERFYPVTWDEVKEAELDDALRATPAQRLAWLERSDAIGLESRRDQRHEL